ncbi:MAG: hypothetical protein HY686_06805 [Chloroflexi bacterium]|nr:hypothetical protein [Chloroflexota bacterium]
MPNGITVKQGSEGDRIEVQCMHQNGLLYVVPSQASWVCSPGHRHAHALAGFFKELARLGDPQVQELMQRWGLYFRERPIEAAAQEGQEAAQRSAPSR